MIINDIMKLRKKGAKQCDVRNRDTYQMYLNKLLEMALCVYEWENLPEEIDSRYVELTLILEGRIGCTRLPDKYGNKLCMLKVANNGGLNMYENYSKFNVYSPVGDITIPCTDLTGVVGFSNRMRVPYTEDLHHFAERLSDIQRTIDVRNNQHKMPVMYRTNKKGVITLKTIFQKISNNESAVFIDDSLDMTNVIADVKEINFIQDKLQTQLKTVWNDAMLFLGVDNSKQDKKERLVVAEVSGNNEQIALIRDIGLSCRQEFANKVNKMFGTDIKVKYREEQVMEVQTDVSEFE